jgi:hypothetical protein
VSRAYGLVIGARPLFIETLRLGYGVGIRDFHHFRILDDDGDEMEPPEERHSKYLYSSSRTLWDIFSSNQDSRAE